MSDVIYDELERFEKDTSVDRVIVPRRLLDVIRPIQSQFTKPRTNLLVDREKKIHSTSRFCR
jgi:hypothetical protein